MRALLAVSVVLIALATWTTHETTTGCVNTTGKTYEQCNR